MTASNLNGLTIINADHKALAKGAFWYYNAERTLIAYLEPAFATATLCEECVIADDSVRPQFATRTLNGMSVCEDCAQHLVKNDPRLASELYA